MCVLSDTLRLTLVWFGGCLQRGTCRHFTCRRGKNVDTSISVCKLLMSLDSQRNLQWPGGNQHQNPQNSREKCCKVSCGLPVFSITLSIQHIYPLNMFVFCCPKLKWNYFFWSDVIVWISFITFSNNNQSAVNMLRHCAECKSHSFRSDRDFVASNSPSAGVWNIYPRNPFLSSLNGWHKHLHFLFISDICAFLHTFFTSLPLSLLTVNIKV